MVQLLSLDPQTMLTMIVFSSFLQAGIMTVLDIVANQYKGISLYMVAAIFYALGVSVALFPVGLESTTLKFWGNVSIISSRVLLAISIQQFLGTRINQSIWKFLIILLLLSQFYYLFIQDDYINRNLWLLIINITIYSILVKCMFKSKTYNFVLTSRLMIAIFGIEILISLMRAVLLLGSDTKSAIDTSSANTLGWLFLFFVDFLRNGLFVLMVSQRMYSDLKEVSEIDFLTQIFNRGALTAWIEKSLKKSTIYPVSLILLDIDYFKRINDTYGHDVGDIIIKTVVHLIQSQLSPQDVIGRWGGEEFLVVLPNCTPSQARDRAESLRYQVEQSSQTQDITTGAIVQCTISLGVVTCLRKTTTLDNLLKPADIALYDAKKAGRNRAEYIIIS
ncbi:MAG: GGDEF domain-containing protein [Phormidium sp.]